MRFLQLFSLPLLTKELIEQSQQKRTYILRAVYAMALYVPALIQYWNISGGGTAAGLMNFGKGRDLFIVLCQTQMWMILLLMPPITCGALTVEKEKDTLALLILTKLAPWTIVFEKFLSRIFTMATYQLLSLPLFAIVYGIGGVDLTDVVSAVIALMVLTIVVASISIYCSTWYRTTSTAFVMTYVFLLGFGTIALPTIYFKPTQTDLVGYLRSVSLLSTEYKICIIALPLCLSAACLLTAARVLVPRAFVAPRNIVLDLFQRADRFFNELNRITTGGIVLVPDREGLPLFDPITWRETKKKSLGTFRYQFRILMLLLAPLIFAIVNVMTESRNNFTNPFHAFPQFFWVVAIVCLTIHSTNAVPAERTRQTLDVLLVTPLSSKEIVLEKLSGVRRLIRILTIPFAVLVIFQGVWTGYVLQGSTLVRSSQFWLEIVSTSLTAIIYMPVIMWIGFQLGLRMRTQIQAIISTFALIGAACALPVVLLVLWDSTAAPGKQEPLVLFALRWINPLQVVIGTRDLIGGTDRLTNTFFAIDPRRAWLILGLNFAIYSIIWWRLRRNALSSFSKIVRRVESNGETN